MRNAVFIVVHLNQKCSEEFWLAVQFDLYQMNLYNQSMICFFTERGKREKFPSLFGYKIQSKK